jgi:putative ubiquitin-RnfH superfamily antitoxin RatB of RatAB toxin-antitoxin module
MGPAEAVAVAVTVVVAGADRLTRRQLVVAAGTTVAEAVRRSGALAEHPGLDPAALGYAIYGRAVRADQTVEEGDRIEVLRPLVHDPKARRRALAREGRTLGRSARGR